MPQRRLLSQPRSIVELHGRHISQVPSRLPAPLAPSPSLNSCHVPPRLSLSLSLRALSQYSLMTERCRSASCIAAVTSLSELRTHCWGFCLPLDRRRAGMSPPEAPVASPSELPRRPGSSPAAAELAESLPSPVPPVPARPPEAVVSGHLPDSRPRAGQWPDSNTRTAVSSQEARGLHSGSSRTKPCTAPAQSAGAWHRAGLAGAAPQEPVPTSALLYAA